jgi:membrane-bound inhibitor of C-type lysozyme
MEGVENGIAQADHEINMAEHQKKAAEDRQKQAEHQQQMAEQDIEQAKDKKIQSEMTKNECEEKSLKVRLIIGRTQALRAEKNQYWLALINERLREYQLKHPG